MVGADESTEVWLHIVTLPNCVKGSYYSVAQIEPWSDIVFLKLMTTFDAWNLINFHQVH